jgi:hypothetical protein
MWPAGRSLETPALDERIFQTLYLYCIRNCMKKKKKLLCYFVTLYQIWRLYTARCNMKMITDFEWITILNVVVTYALLKHALQCIVMGTDPWHTVFKFGPCLWSAFNYKEKDVAENYIYVFSPGSFILKKDFEWGRILSWLKYKYIRGARGSIVVKVLCWDPEGRGFKSRWGRFF